MPPDRTTSQLFSHVAATPGIPLSSHGPQHLPSLERGKACLVCRSRKIKCDALKPTCSSCAKSARAHGEQPIPCNYAEPEKRKKATTTSKVQELQNKLDRMEALLQAGGGPSQAAPTPQAPAISPPELPSFSTSGTLPFSYMNSTTTYALSSSQGFNDWPQTSNVASTSTGLPFDSSELFGGTGNSPSFFGQPFDPSSVLGTTAFDASSVAFVSAEAIFSFDTSMPSTSTEMLPFGWPVDLPSPSLLTRLVDAFFLRSGSMHGHEMVQMVHEARLRSDLKLPPTHVNFPSICLLHSIAATAMKRLPESVLVHDSRSWSSAEEFALFHVDKARGMIDHCFGHQHGRKHLQLVQAAILLCWHSYTTARFSTVWLDVSTAVRIATCLGLQHLRRAVVGEDGKLDSNCRGFKSGSLEPTDDPEELRERALTFYATWIGDRIASASTGWTHALDDADVTTLLPFPSPQEYPVEDLILSPLSHHNPNFLVAHPPHLVGVEQLYLKVFFALGRVTSLKSRAPEPMGRGLPPPSFNGEPPDFRTSSAFKRLDSDLVQLRLSIPREYSLSQLLVDGDTRRPLICSVPHLATILLHEPFASLDPTDSESNDKCQLSARAILDTLYLIAGSSYEIALLSPFLNFVWGVAGRTLVRELAIKQYRNQSVGTLELVQEVTTIINALGRHPSPLGASTSQVLTALLAEPHLALPKLGSPAYVSGHKLPENFTPGSQASSNTPPSTTGTSSSSISAPPVGYEHLFAREGPSELLDELNRFSEISGGIGVQGW
ncbi:hypothetical protein BCR35DRAFT_306688 [Leucosporidium creatinivorum]|uniref:Zn(2)-C6 fungal-type domain-containing protein n=1 Tax=Leucosporidium creatinivorum TaxID=106004 RepID=A0A1Y2ESN5_9BASI|nr:hypothetical protein BCR35DRAFT_306688 [Leucosporidium creatinivorum]